MQMELQTNTSGSLHQQKGWKIWWQLTRPHTLTAAFVPVILGTVIALSSTPIDWTLFAAMLLASLLIQAATNMFNEYYDYVRGLDHEGSVGIGGAIVRHGVKPKKVLSLAFILFGIALLLGVYICMNSSWWIAAVGLVSMAAAYFYTGGPIPIAYTPFGEITSGFFMGFVIILISYFIQTGEVTTSSMIISIPVSILIGAILLSNNIRDLDGDKENGRKTLAILIGRNNAIKLLATMFIIAYAWIIMMIFLDYASIWLLVVFLSAPIPIKAVKGFIGKTEPIQMMPAMKATAQTNTVFGFLMSIGYVIAYIF